MKIDWISHLKMKIIRSVNNVITEYTVKQIDRLLVEEIAAIIEAWYCFLVRFPSVSDRQLLFYRCSVKDLFL